MDLFKTPLACRFRGENSMCDGQKNKRKNCENVFVDEVESSIFGMTISENIFTATDVDISSLSLTPVARDGASRHGFSQYLPWFAERSTEIPSLTNAQCPADVARKSQTNMSNEI